jgi:thiopeptide-type bacteriocin biosynthesis protein
MSPEPSRRRLADDVELELTYADTSRFGGLPSGRLRATVRERCAAIYQHWREHGATATIARSEALLAAAWDAGLGELYRSETELLPEVLYPPAEAIRPSELVVLREGAELLRVPLTPGLTRDLARWVGDFTAGAPAPRAAEAAALHAALESVGAFTDRPADPRPGAEGTFVGHAALLLGRVLVDPFLLPQSTRFPAGYQPLTAAELGPLDAVCVTHGHPDHFALGSLLKFGAATPIVVPRVAKESALAIGMAHRLAEVGFERVVELGWHEEQRLGEARVVALPFLGEQPTTGARLHPEVRNQGNAYLVEVGERRFVAVADSGRDAEGDAVALAERMRSRFGRIDVLFGGYRAFPLYPIEYLDSSVSEWLLFVPRDGWCQRQKIMYDPDELVDLAEAWRARHVVPYACGGAPWYWERGLGAVLDATQPGSRADPAPSAVEEAARWRTGSDDAPRASPIDVVVLRPGDGFRVEDARLAAVRAAPHAWPFAPAADATEAPERPHRWLQLNVAVRGEDDERAWRESAWRLFRRVYPLVTELRATGALRTFFFQCKPPGFRLRVELVGDDHARSAGRLRGELDRAVAIGAVASWGAAVYEPEERVFGGADVMTEVHHAFDVDTGLYLERLGLSRSTVPHPVCDAVTWLAFVADDLAAHLLEEGHECWDVYVKLAERHGLDVAPPAGVEALPRAGLSLPLGEQDLLARYRAEHRRFAGAVARLWEAGKVGVGRRALVANVIQFMLNRHQLPPEAQAAVIQVLLRTREPTGSGPTPG